MARQKSYYELLKHPNWQRKRLKIMERSGFSCEKCESTTNTLNVHHTYYEKGKQPWEYPDESLMCLCEDCHEKITGLMTKLHRELGRLSWEGIEQVYGYLQSVRSCDEYIDDDPAHLDCTGVSCAQGLADYYHLQDMHIMEIIERQGYVTAIEMHAAGDKRDSILIHAIVNPDETEDTATVIYDNL